MIWHCDKCGYAAAAGLVSDLREGDHACCPGCSHQMIIETENIESQLAEIESSLAGVS